MAALSRCKHGRPVEHKQSTDRGLLRAVDDSHCLPAAQLPYSHAAILRPCHKQSASQYSLQNRLVSNSVPVHSCGTSHAAESRVPIKDLLLTNDHQSALQLVNYIN